MGLAHVKQMGKLLIFFCLIPSLSFAAGTLTPGVPKVVRDRTYVSTEYSATFVAAGGDVSIDDVATGIGGYLKEVRYIAGSMATADIIVYDRNDANKVDLLGGAGSNMGTGIVTPLKGGAYGYADVMGNLYVTVDGETSAGTGTIVLVVGY